jgi:hypothetical protein
MKKLKSVVFGIAIFKSLILERNALDREIKHLDIL